MAYINVDEVYILDNTGLQVDMTTDIPFVDAGFTDAQKEQARANIGAGGTNPNLLDNPFFQINQRSATTITGNTTGEFSVDRWRLFGTSTSLTVTSTGVSVYSKTNGFAQRFDDAIGAFLNGKTVTLSVMDDSGNIASGTLIYDNTTLKNTGALTIGSYTVTLYAGKSGAYQLFSILTGENTINFRAAKLELGTVSTLANDVSPNYAEELDKCLYYFERIKAVTNLGLGTGIGNGTRFYTPFSIHPKRATPTISYIGTISIGRSAVETAITGIYTSGTECDYASGHIQLGVNVTNTSGTPYRLILEAGGTLDFSADL